MDLPELSEPHPGVLRIRYERSEQLLPECMGGVLEALSRLGRERPLVLLHEVGPAVRQVPIRVPTFWLDVTSRAELRLAGMAVVSASLAVRSAANAFGLANQLRQSSLRVQAFVRAEEALAWAAALAATG